jgi:hypothetical protein
VDLSGRRILVVEDEFFIAQDVLGVVASMGAIVVGPATTLEKAMRLASSDDTLDAAILDVHVHGELIFPVAELLIGRGVPFVLATGYDAAFFPPSLATAPRLQKPFELGAVSSALCALLA